MDVLLVGLEGLGLRTLEHLLADGHRVRCLATPDASAYVAEAAELGAQVVSGDHRRVAVLREAGLAAVSAVVVTVEDDVANLHCALAAQEERPGVRLVLRMFNTTLAARVAALVPAAACLSASALAAPALVAAALDEAGGQRVQVLGRPLVVRPAGHGGSPPVATLSDGLVLVDGDAADARPRRSRQRRELLAAGRVLLADRRLAWLGAVFVTIVAAATAIFAVFRDLPVDDALYFTFTLVTTIGYGDITLLDAGLPLKLFGMALMLVGAAATATLFGLIADTLLGLRLSRLAGGPPPRGPGGHVIVCGLGTVGFRVVEDLVARGVDVVAVEADEDGAFVPAARALGVHVMTGRAELPGTLLAQDVERCRCLVVATSDDAANLEAALEARALRPDLRVVLRLFDPDLADRVERAFGLYRSRSVSALAAPAFALAVTGRHVLASIPTPSALHVIEEVELEGPTTAAALAASTGATLLAVGAPSGPRWSPPPGEGLATGETAVLLVAVSVPAVG